MVNCSASSLYIPEEKRLYSDERWGFLVGVYVMFLVSAVVFLGIFYWGKKVQRYERLRIRRMALVYIPSLVLLVQAQIGPGFVMFGINNFPCWIRSILTMMIVPLMASNIVLRLMIFFFLSELSKEMPMLQQDEFPEDKGTSVIGRMTRGLVDIFYAVYALLFPGRSRMSRARIVKALTFVASAKGTLIIFLLILAPFLVVALILVFAYPVYVSCTGCSLALSEIVEIIGVGLFFLAFGAVAAFKVRNYPDPWGLRREVTYMVSWALLALLGFVVATFFDPAKDVTYDHQFIIYLGMGGFAWVQTVYQVYQAYLHESGAAQALDDIRRRRMEKLERKKFKSVTDSNVNSTTTMQATVEGRLVLKSVLENAALAQFFEKFLVDELGVESLMFLRDTAEWKKSYFDIASTARFARAKRLYNTYISPTGSFPVNIPADAITRIKVKILKEGLTDCPEDVFDAAREEISDLLQIGALMRFQTSPLYQKYLEDHQMGRIQTAEL